MTTEYDVDEVYWKIEQHAKDLMNLYRNYKGDDCLDESGIVGRNCCRDCLHSMVLNGLIRGYDLSTGEILL